MYRIVITPPKSGEATLEVRQSARRGAATTSKRQPSRKAANAELQFEGPLAGLTLTGFSIFDNGPEGYRVSFPTRRFVAAGGAPGSYLLLRATNADDRTAYERLKDEILGSFHVFNETRSTHHVEAAS